MVDKEEQTNIRTLYQNPLQYITWELRILGIKVFDGRTTQADGQKRTNQYTHIIPESITIYDLRAWILSINVFGGRNTEDGGQKRTNKYIHIITEIITIYDLGAKDIGH